MINDVTTGLASQPPAITQPAPAAALPASVAELPTQEGPKGLRFDFNEGARIACPESAADWTVRLKDLDTGNILFETRLKDGRVASTARYFVRFCVEVEQNGQPLLAHAYDAKDREVLIRFPVDTLGDVIGWFPYAVKFKEKHGCKLTCAMEARLAALFRDTYPDITFVTHEEVTPDRYYATYTIAVFFKGGAIHDHKPYVPSDIRFVGLHRAAGYMLGVDPTETRPRIALADDSRPITERYVCIAVQSTLQAKYWNNQAGWAEIVRFLKSAGYRVLCIDQKRVHGQGQVLTCMPEEAEDFTGDRPLAERARFLKHADFFIGLSSGLSWLAWAMKTPVVMISGLTHPLNEFDNPYRVINYHVCNSCWNDPKGTFNRDDFMSCPRHQGTARQFECTRLITPEQVKTTIGSLPAFTEQIATQKQRQAVTYNPAVFNTPTMESAKAIILTAEGSSSDERWRVETPYVADLIAENISLSPATMLLDYGCGVGRLARILIERHGCSVIGVDISEDMRKLAPNYVQSERFRAVSPEEFRALLERGQRFDAAIAIWVLQHCMAPAEDIARLRQALEPGAKLFVLNNRYRAVPTREKSWVNDGIDISAMLQAEFTLAREGQLLTEKAAPRLEGLSFWALFEHS
jgi:autotransporter strand-loop-strand O-heptosyltransferase